MTPRVISIFHVLSYQFVKGSPNITERQDNKKAVKAAGKKKMEGAALIGIDVAKEEDLSEWYQQVILKSDMLEFSDVPGCYIYAPGSYAIWEYIREFIDARIKKMGVKNCYFPLFISEANLSREQDHLDGFEAEVAWVTHGGKNKLEKRLAVRPTSETAMYGYYAKKIRSHRDLPLRLNQWNNIVRWEFKHAMPFLRSREILWQEGHTAFLTKEEAEEEVMEILNNVYATCYEELLAVPVVRGKKTKNETFAGADYSLTVEGFIGAVGRGIQCGTAHLLGQHFSKMFDITVEDPSIKVAEGAKREKTHVWQNSWGFSTRSIGVMIMVHSDNKGLVLPPRCAETQVVIIPAGLSVKTSPEDKSKLLSEIASFAETLRSINIRVEVDDREEYSSGWKYNNWELKGVPLRIEYGPKDSTNKVVATSRRDTGEKGSISTSDLKTAVPELLEKIQADLLAKATKEYADHRKIVTDWKDFVPLLNAKNVCVIPHCLDGKCEDKIKELSTTQQKEGEVADVRAPSMGAKSLCIPFEQPEGIQEGVTKCVNPECSAMAKKWVMFGRSY